jgi:hypothetical protein
MEQLPQNPPATIFIRTKADGSQDSSVKRTLEFADSRRRAICNRLGGCLGTVTIEDFRSGINGIYECAGNNSDCRLDNSNGEAVAFAKTTLDQKHPV